MIIIPTRTWNDLRPLRPDERVSRWAAKYPTAKLAQDTVVDMARTRRLKLAKHRNRHEGVK